MTHETKPARPAERGGSASVGRGDFVPGRSEKAGRGPSSKTSRSWKNGSRRRDSVVVTLTCAVVRRALVCVAYKGSMNSTFGTKLRQSYNRGLSGSWLSSKLPRVVLAMLGPLAVAWSGCSFPEYGTVAEPSVRPTHCANRQKDANESDYDCGGGCMPCETGQTCLMPEDCASGVCLAGTCAAPSCADGLKNGRESDVDCGEACTPARCASGNHCNFNEDCNSVRCEAGACAAASCSDRLRNGAESDVDCGGPNCEPCATGSSCGADQDCTTRICSEAQCAPPSCRNVRVDPGETDIDCGGGTCGPCGGDAMCRVGADCLSGHCTEGHCVAASCNDALRNQAETDVDCGGSGCGPCAANAACLVGDNCQSGVCVQQMCSSPTCTDFVQNGDETGVDCGGSCPACATGAACSVGADCASGICSAGACAPARCDDGVKNGSESDVDCGQGCKPCSLDRLCATGDDCASGKCNTRCVSTVRVELRAGNQEASTVCIQPCFNLVNDGSKAIELKDLSIRYYYTKELSGAESYDCYWVSNGDCNQLAPAIFTNLDPSRPGAGRYLELSFTDVAKTLPPDDDFTLQGGFCMPDGKQFTQTGDYSYNGSATYESTSKVVVLKDGVRIWGNEP
jgi:hypothetical protein